MSITLPDGWTNFSGGGTNALCGEPQTAPECPEPPCFDIPAFQVDSSLPGLDCLGETESVLTASGGVPPYTWSVVSGNVTLSSTTGDTVVVSLFVNNFPKKLAFLVVIPKAWSVETLNGCGAGISGYNADFETLGGSAAYYDCNGELICTDVSIPDCTTVGLIGADCNPMVATCVSCHNVDFPFCDGSCRGSPVIGGICSTPGNDPDVTFRLTVNPSDAGFGDCNGASFDQTFNVPLGTGSLFTAVGVGATSRIDLRTDQMIAAGCGCFDGTVILLVTDYVGNQLVVVLHE